MGWLRRVRSPELWVIPSHPRQAPPPAHYAPRDGISGGPRGTVSQRPCGVMPAWPFVFCCLTVKIGTLGKRPLLAQSGHSSREARLGYLPRGLRQAKAGVRQATAEQAPNGASRPLPASANPDEPFAGILAAIETGDRSRRVFDAVQYVFGIAQSSIANPPRQTDDGLVEPGRVVEDD